MKLPRIPSEFRIAKNSPKRFEYKPTTYDEQKEKLEERRTIVENEIAREQRIGDNYESHLRERIADSWSQRETRRQKKASSYRLLVILAILVLNIYAIYSKIA